jgi:hypothetical protein
MESLVASKPVLLGRIHVNPALRDGRESLRGDDGLVRPVPRIAGGITIEVGLGAGPTG